MEENMAWVWDFMRNKFIPPYTIRQIKGLEKK